MIVIKGMTMPKNCYDCPFENLRGMCCAAARKTESVDRPEWCPLVEVVMPNIVHRLNDIEIVRCKDCRYNYANMIPNGKGCQQNVYIETADNWYCADGERKDEVEE